MHTASHFHRIPVDCMEHCNTTTHPPVVFLVVFLALIAAGIIAIVTLTRKRTSDVAGAA